MTEHVLFGAGIRNDLRLWSEFSCRAVNFLELRNAASTVKGALANCVEATVAPDGW